MPSAARLGAVSDRIGPFQAPPQLPLRGVDARPDRALLHPQRSRDLGAGELFVETIKLEYDHRAWERCFLSQWPEGSPAHRSYYGRISKGPDYQAEQARRPMAALAA